MSISNESIAHGTRLQLRVSHFPPGTSKWNKIEHRLFSFISMNWRGEPLVSHEVMLNLIANTKARNGLTVRAELDNAPYPIIVSKLVSGHSHQPMMYNQSELLEDGIDA